MEKHTKGRWKIKLHYGSVLGPAKETIDGLKAGMYEAAMFCVGYAPAKVPLLRIVELPFITPTEFIHTAKLVAALIEHPAIKKSLAKMWNVVPFLPGGLPTYHLMGNKAIRTVADLKGVRMRISGDQAKVLRAFGAVPTMVPAPELYETLARGTIDLAGFPWSYAYGAYKLHEVSKYINIPMTLGTMGCPPLANKDAYDALPEEFKTLHKLWFDNAAYVWAEEYAAADRKWIPIFKKKLEWIDFPVSERNKLVAKAGEFYDAWIKDMEAKGLPGQEIMDFFLKKRKELSGS
jgi:TRAP-type C4-dicarboxylate transport system substrate-binding protein